jgi:hypothetical protein
MLHKMPLWSIYVAGNFEISRSSCKVVDGALKQKNVHLPMAFFRRRVWGKQVVMTDMSLRSFSVSVSAAIKQFTRSDGINKLWSNKY